MAVFQELVVQYTLPLTCMSIVDFVEPTSYMLWGLSCSFYAFGNVARHLGSSRYLLFGFHH